MEKNGDILDQITNKINQIKNNSSEDEDEAQIDKNQSCEEIDSDELEGDLNLSGDENCIQAQEKR